MTAAQNLRGNIHRLYAWKALTSLHFFAGVLVPFFTQWGGISFRQVLWLQTWFMLWMVALEVPTGAVADRFGRRASLFCATLCLIAAVAYYITHRGLLHFLFAEFLWACAAAFASGADEALAYDSLKAVGFVETSKAVLARLSAAEILAISVAAPIGSIVAARWGLLAPLALGLFPFIAALPVAWSLREPAREYKERQGCWEIMTQATRYFAGHRVLRALAFDSVTIRSLSFMIIWLYQPRLKELGVPLIWFGFVSAAMTLLQAAVLLRIEAVERLLGGARRYLLVSALVPGFAYLALAGANSPLVVATLAVLISGFGLSRSVILGNDMQRHIDSSRRATVLAAVGMIRQLFTAAVYPIVGWAAEISLSWTFFGLGVAALACAALSSVEDSRLNR